MPSAAQLTPYVGGGGGLVEGMGLRNPNWTPTAGLDLRQSSSLLNVELSGDTANKIDAQSGTLLRLIARGYWRRDHLLMGAGVSRSHEYTGSYDKVAWHPRLALGFQANQLSVFGDYILPQGDPQNSVQGVQARFEYPVNRYLHFRYETQVLHFHGTFAEDDKHWGGTSTLSLLFRFHGWVGPNP